MGPCAALPHAGIRHWERAATCEGAWPGGKPRVAEDGGHAADGAVCGAQRIHVPHAMPVAWRSESTRQRSTIRTAGDGSTER